MSSFVVEYKTRLLLALQNVVKEASKFPLTNLDNIDILSLLQMVRNKFKLVKALFKWPTGQFEFQRVEKPYAKMDF